MKIIQLIIVLKVCILFGLITGTVLIADNSMSRMIELTTTAPYCHIHRDRGTIRSMLLSSDPRRVRQMTDNSITKLVAICNSQYVHSAHQGGFIYPGTKWCGPGNIAANYSDIGYHSKEDMCCREHDHCPNSLSRDECRQGICNTSAFTRSHCDCDAKFRRCLQNVNSESANTIGAIFFNVVQVICFKVRTPCSEWQSLTGGNSNITNQNTTDCMFEFHASRRYRAKHVLGFNYHHKKEYFFNRLLKKLRLL